MSGATTCMAEGEVLELLKPCDLDTREEEYLEVVTNKTAVLIAAACEVGALLGEADPACAAALREYGMHVGVAFQLMDDCLDYVGDRDEFGKTVIIVTHDQRIGQIADSVMTIVDGRITGETSGEAFHEKTVDAVRSRSSPS